MEGARAVFLNNQPAKHHKITQNIFQYLNKHYTRLYNLAYSNYYLNLKIWQNRNYYGVINTTFHLFQCKDN